MWHASTSKPDIQRLLAVFKGEKTDRTPNFEITFNQGPLSTILNRQMDYCSALHAPPEISAEAAMAVGQDAIACWTRIEYEGASICTLADLEKMPPQNYSKLHERLASYLKAVAGTGIGIIPSVAGPFSSGYQHAGPISIQSFLELIYLDPELVDALLDYHTECAIQTINTLADLPFHAWYIGDDVGGFVGPEHLQALWAVRQEKIVAAAKATGRPVIFHNCGPTMEILPYLDKWGVDAVHPIQPIRNDIYEIRKLYPSLTLIGNMDVSALLSFGTPEMTRADTREHIERLGQHGRYVVSSSHSLIDSVKMENYRAMVETAWDS